MKEWIEDVDKIREIKNISKCPFCGREHCVEKTSESGTRAVGPDMKLPKVDKIWFCCLESKGGCGKSSCVAKNVYENLK